MKSSFATRWRIAICLIVSTFAAAQAQAGRSAPIDEPTLPDAAQGAPAAAQCGSYRELLASRHFTDIEAVECTGQVHIYTGWLHGSFYIIRVSASSGKILSEKPVMLRPLHDQ